MRDGPLKMELRYPANGVQMAGDSIAAWGTLGTGRAILTINGVRVQVEPNGAFASYVATPKDAERSLVFVARRGSDSVRHVVQLAKVAGGEAKSSAAIGVRPLTTWVRMQRLPSDTADSATQARPIYTRWRPDGQVALGLMQGMRVHADAETDDALRLDISKDVSVWVPRVDALPAPARARTLRAGRLTINPDVDSGVVLRIPLSEPVPTSVELSGDRLIWTIHGAEWATPPAPADVHSSMVRRVVPQTARGGRVVVDLGLSAMPIGWRSEWTNGELRLRVRRPHAVGESLKGMRILLDPGHPPDGSMGAAGLAEDSVTLAVALAAERQLRSLGADVALTRRDSKRLSLEARAATIEQRSPEVFVSIHANSPGPGRPPIAVDRTFVYWMDPHAIQLARNVAENVAESLGQPLYGQSQGEYAVLRSSWATSVLVEGFGLVLPEREAFMRSGDGVEAYATGIVKGIQKWSRSPRSRALPPIGPR